MVGFATVSEIASLRLCNSCGGCAWICPAGAIALTETSGGCLLPRVDPEVCTRCGLCVSICPGVHFCKTLSNAMPPDPFIGTVIATHVGSATDPQVFENSQSGGVVSALIATALDSGMIGGALTVAMSATHPARPAVVLSKSRSQLVQCQKSKYCPVPLLTGLEHVKDSPRPIAVVGLPCQLHGLWNITQRKPELKSKIAFTVGLVCDRIMTYAAIDFLIKKSKLPPDQVVRFHFRDKTCGGYPGNVYIAAKNKAAAVMPFRRRTEIKDFFTPARCLLCFDKLNVFADVVVGDPHGVSDYDHRRGASVIIVRTQKGGHVFNDSLNGGRITARSVALEDIVAGQAISRKKKDWSGFTHAWEKMGRPLPDYVPGVRLQASPRISRRRHTATLKQALSLDGDAGRDQLYRRVNHSILLLRIKKLLRAPRKLFSVISRGRQNRRIRSSGNADEHL